MTLASPPPPAAPPRASRETIGRVLAVSGAQVTVGLSADRARQHRRAPRSENSSASSAAAPSSSA